MALGAAVGGAVLGRKAGPRAFVWGAICGTLPDLDVLISHGDAIRDFTFHRAETHAFFYQTLAAPLIALAPHRLHRREGVSYRAWLLLVWLCLTTHAVLDAFTVYGTQLLLPFSDFPVGLGSIFVIDPLYTLPLLVGMALALALGSRSHRAAAWNAGGLAIATLYLGWSVAAQSHVAGVVQRSLAASGVDSGRVLVTPTAFNTLLWRVVVMEETGFREGFVSLFDGPGPVAFTAYPSRVELIEPLRTEWTVQRLAWFSKGFYAVALADSTAVAAAPRSPDRAAPIAAAAAAGATAPGDAVIVMADLRMGQVPWFVFTFVVGEVEPAGIVAVEPQQLPVQRPTRRVLRWIWHRIWTESAGAPPVATRAD